MAKLIEQGEEGVAHMIGEEEVTIGRGINCQISILDVAVSRMHCTVKKQGLEYILTDNSVNGVLVNDVLVEKTSRKLKNNDVITIACKKYIFKQEEVEDITESTIIDLAIDDFKDAEVIVLEDEYYLKKEQEKIAIANAEVKEEKTIAPVDPSFIESLKEEVTCPICCELYIQALNLNCSHTFCFHCLGTWLNKNKNPCCPICREKITSSTPVRHMDNVIEMLVAKFTDEEKAAREETKKSRENIAKKSRGTKNNRRSRKRRANDDGLLEIFEHLADFVDLALLSP